MDSVDSGLPGGHAPPHWYDTWDRQTSQTFSSTAKGLRNAPGENNCFLNSAVQVFWHIDVFRRSYRRLSGHLCMGHSCIFCALKVIFTQFQYSDQSSLQPCALRKALANTFAKQERFQLGHMDDAAECFENILHRIHYHIASSHNEDTCDAPHCIPHQKFAMTVCDQLVCPCGSKSEPLKFHELVHYISANALVSQWRTMQESGDILHPNRFGLLLRNARAFGDVRDCPDNCGKRVQIRRSLLNIPDVVSVGLVWGSDKPDTELTTEVARAIGTTLLLPDIFHSVMNDVNKLPRLQLTSLVCYYGKHYSSFVYHTKLDTWIYFDDATVRDVGPHWDNVVEKIVRSRYQPLLLIYTNLNAQPVPTETAPSTRVMAPGYSMVPPKEENKTPAGVVKNTENKDSEMSEKGGNEKEQLGRKSSFEHRRQSSFLLAVTKQKHKEEVIYAVPHNNSKVQNLQKDISQADSRVMARNGSYSMDVPDGPQNPDSYNYTLSTSDQYRRPAMSSPDPNKLPLTPNFSRVAETQRKESFKKGKGKVGADVIRYHVDGTRRTSISSESDPGSPVHGETKSVSAANGKPALPEKPKHVRTRSQSLEDNMCNLADNGPAGNNSHTIIKPKPSGMAYDNVDTVTRAHTPVQSGLATLPRNKKPGSKNPGSSVPSSSQSSGSFTQPHYPGSQYTMAAHSHDIPSPAYSMGQPIHSGYQSCLTYQNVVDSDHHSRQSSSSSILSQSTVVECPPGDHQEGTHVRQSSSVSTDTLTDVKPMKETKIKKKKDKDENNKKKEESKQRKEEKKQKVKKEKSGSKPPQVPDKRSQQPDEGFQDEQYYIDRRMVESVLSFQKLQRSGSCVSQTSNSSVDSDNYGRGFVTGPKDQPTEIPFDSASLDSHKDSGYGSSDRNSSSSTGSITMNPYEQYFLSRSMIPPKTINPQLMAENMRKLMGGGSGMSGLEYTQEKDLKSLVTNPGELYNQTATVGYVQQHPLPQYPQGHPMHQPVMHPGLPQKDLRTMSKEDRDKHLYDALSGNKKTGPPQVSPKPQQGQQPGTTGTHPGLSQGGRRPNDKGLQHFPEGQGQPNVQYNGQQQQQQHVQNFQDGTPNQQFFTLCQGAEDLMDRCVLAETSEQYGDAQSFCQQAIDSLKNAMKLPGIGQSSYTYAQRTSNSCILKLRSLQKRLMNRQESNTSTNSSDSGINSDFRKNHGVPLKSPHLAQLSNSGVRPPSRSSSQNSMDSLKDGSTTSSSGRSTTPVFDKTRPPTDERVPPVSGHIPGDMHNGFKDRSFETGLPEGSSNNNADLYGTLPRRKTQKSQDHTRMCNNQKHEAEVYQDFIDNQRRQNGVNPLGSSSGPRNQGNELGPDMGINYHMSQNRQGSQCLTKPVSAPSHPHPGLAPVPVNPPSISNQSHHTESQPDLRHLSSGEQVSMPQRPLTPQVLCSEFTEEDSRPVSVRDLMSRFEATGISGGPCSSDNPGGSSVNTNTSNVHHHLGHVNSVPALKVKERTRGSFQRQRSKSESETVVQQPPRPKSALSKRTKTGDRVNKPRKSVTFSANICLVAAIDNFLTDHDHTQAGYQSDEEDRLEFLARHARRNDDEDSSTSDSPVEAVGDAACMLCHKLGVEPGHSYCSKCTYYMSRFTPSR